MISIVRCAATVASLAASTGCLAVTHNPEGVGQALIFPYYTANSSGGNWKRTRR